MIRKELMTLNPEISQSLADYQNRGDRPIAELAANFYGAYEEMLRLGHMNYRRVTVSGSQPKIMIRDLGGEIREMSFFASNDYLNLTKHPRTVAAGIAAVEKYGSGAGSVPLLGGTLDIHVELEKKVAKFKGCENAILFSNGFGSNCGSIAALLGENGCAVCDMLIHASLLDGTAAGNTEFFLHNNPSSLERALEKAKKKSSNILVIVDGVYSMDGDICPLDKICELAHAAGALVLVDEAHATGVIGEHGRGTPEHFNLEGKVDLVAGTFSKGIGSVGGFIASTKELINYLYFYARSYMFSTAITPQATASISAALDVIEEEPWLREALWKNINYFKAGLDKIGFDLGNAQTAIFPIIVGDDFIVKEMCRECHAHGIYVNPVVYPAVQRRQARLRFSLMCNHTKEQLDDALNFLEYLNGKYQVVK
ncbi:MAG: aminotransferase class I/II-fold pyridoxal phosphate-dependent enzyme [Clostridia bacterium]|nr:aminotransferase class I/II-fold pyridoxal phosphate-dependent enzyme [Clostridia bacterium]